ncbi:amidohydrolase family protein [Roseomonas sp. SSH11]|uniref:Amidohydrolase family protein n=1 Tax=Pararoseomonas baculiformis TaxID=2820812 RepID=A0ABS4A8K1_9PROT|nr:amidohydrolase family protein [Pararoseomonas baculiformis]MBP0443325.1 amidohydrolase family protein [Pararoseomonas baculiformis]
MADSLPPRIVDTHHHIYDARMTAYPGTRPPPDAPLSAYAALRRRLGITHHVLVQPSTYGLDNALHLAARAEAPAASRVVAVIPPGTGMAECRRLTAAGVVGLRANLAHPVPLAPGDVPALGRLCADQGWHLQVFASADLLAELAPALRALPCPLVLDHFAMLPPEGFAAHPAWPLVADLLAAGRAWVKLSSPYALPPGDPAPLVRALAGVGEGQLLWGTNWPHPNSTQPQDEAALREAALAPLSPAQRAAVLWDNPARLYGFAA